MRRTVQLAVKHSLDRFLAAVFLCLLAPVLLVIAVAILVESGRPAVFVQPRIGRGGRRFPVYKFRTMVHGDVRITRIGAFLRSWSLDELPQLVNVLRGEMSFVGPRPTLAYQVGRYTPFQRRRLEMHAGITGWAQVNGRNTLSWIQRIDLDVWYVDHFSLLLDVRILVRTISVCLRREGLYGP